MADNTALETVSVAGDTIATDDIGGVKYPRSKIVIGADGTNDGDVSAANPLPVDLGTNNDVTLAELPDTAAGDLAAMVVDLAAIEVTQNTIAGDTTSIDGKITACDTGAVVLSSGTVTTVSTVTNLAQLGGVAVSMNTGVRDTGTQRVTIATDDSVPVTGTITANLGATDNAVLDTIETNTDFGAVVGGGVEATALRVTLANDSTGVVSIDDGGGSITVDGTFFQATQPVSIAGTVTVDLGANNDVATVADATDGAAHGASQTGFRLLGSDGTNDVQIRTDATGNVQVEGTVTANAGVGTFTVDGSGVTQPVSAVSLPLPTGASTEATLSTASTTLSTISGNITACNTGAVVISSGSVAVPSVATGGATPGKLISAATTNATSVKASAATLYSLQVFNTNAAARYFKIYNKASAPTVGTDVPVQVYTIPGNTAGAGLVVPIPTSGIALSTGFAFATTTGAADSDTAAVAANEIVVSYSYK